MFRQHTAQGLGYKRPSYESNVSRSQLFMSQLSADLGEALERLIQSNEESSVSDWRKVERQHMDEAAVELLTVISAMPQPIREVVELRATGMSWKRICDSLPKRVYFSIIDDWKRALAILNERHDYLLNRFR